MENPNVLQFLTRHGWDVLVYDEQARLVFAHDTTDPKTFAIVRLGETHTVEHVSVGMSMLATRIEIFQYLRRKDVEQAFATPQAYGHFTVHVDEALLERGM